MLEVDLSGNAIPLSGVSELVEGSLAVVEGEPVASTTSELLPSSQTKTFFLFSVGGDDDDLFDSELVVNVLLRFLLLVCLQWLFTAVPLSLESEL